jgi:uncharacterized membrane protein
MIKKHSAKLMILFAVAGLLLSLWSYREHFTTSNGAACNINATFNCDLVNKSVYSTIFGVPVAAIGVGGYLALILLGAAWGKQRDPLLLKIYILCAVGGLGFALYLTYLEAFVIHAWCLICLASLSSIIGATASGLVAGRVNRDQPVPAVK